MWSRVLFSVFFFLALTSGVAQSSGSDRLALIIVQSKNMGPRIDPKIDVHIPTIVWPPSLVSNGSNRLLSLMTGLDWEGKDYDLSFSVRAGELAPDLQSYRADGFDSLLSRGYFLARERYLGNLQVRPVSRPSGLPTTSHIGLLLSADRSNDIHPIAFDAAAQEHGLLVFEAESWEEQNMISTAVQGRSLVLELPDPNFVSGPNVDPNDLLGHVFFRGIGWPDGWPIDPETKVAGLIRARNALKVLLHPESFAWTKSPPAHDSPRLWFAHVRGLVPTLFFSFSLIIIYALGSAAYCITVEHRGHLASWAMIGTALAPAAFLISGMADRIWGVEIWFWTFSAALALLGTLGHFLRLTLQRWGFDSHPLLAFSLVGLAACVIGDPTWSPLSRVFSPAGQSLSPEAIGAVACYLCCAITFLQPTNGGKFFQPTFGQWVGRGLALICFLAALFGMGWWSGGDWVLCTFPILAWLAGEALLPPPFFVVWALLPHGANPYQSASDLWRYGSASSPLGCVPDLNTVHALNVFYYLDFLLNPGTILFGLTLGTIIVLSNNFFLRQIWHSNYRDPRVRAMPTLALGLLATGILAPVLLPAAMIAGFGALIVVLYSALQPANLDL